MFSISVGLAYLLYLCMAQISQKVEEMVENTDLAGWKVGRARRESKRQPKMCKQQVHLFSLFIRYFSLINCFRGAEDLSV